MWFWIIIASHELIFDSKKNLCGISITFCLSCGFADVRAYYAYAKILDRTCFCWTILNAWSSPLDFYKIWNWLNFSYKLFKFRESFTPKPLVLSKLLKIHRQIIFFPTNPVKFDYFDKKMRKMENFWILNSTFAKFNSFKFCFLKF